MLVNTERSLADFLSEYRDAFTQQIDANYPAEVTDVHRTAGTLRQPFEEQLPAIEGVVKCLLAHKYVVLNGEMGTGKTTLSVAAMYRLAVEVSSAMRFKRVLVVAPPHLVLKWKRETEAIIPNASVAILETPSDVDRMRDMPTPAFGILSRERAKLGSAWVPAYVSAKRVVKFTDGTLGAVPRKECPRCANPVADEHGKARSHGELAAKRHHCGGCGERLWRDIPSPRRYPLARYIRNRFRKFFEACVIDEAHEFLGPDSAQGVAAHTLANSVTYTLPMTGTLTDGKASRIFYMYKRFTDVFDAEYDLKDEEAFVKRFGTFERVIKDADGDTDHRTSRGRKRSERKVEKAGSSPHLLPYILPCTVFVKLRHVAKYLPPYHEEIHTLTMNEDQAKAHSQLLQQAKGALGWSLSPRARSLLRHAMLNHPDMPYFGEHVVQETRNGPEIVAHVEPLSEARLYPKEIFACDLVEDEWSAGRRVAFFVERTGARDMGARLASVLERAGHNVALLRSGTVPTKHREAWLAKQVANGANVLITHPKMVDTGLDLLDYSTFMFYQITNSGFVMRQVAKRFYRIGKKEPVKGIFGLYDQTLQGSALANVATKIVTSLALEGDIVEGGIADAADDDLFLAMTRDLMSGNLGAPSNLGIPVSVTASDYLKHFNLVAPRARRGQIATLSAPVFLTFDQNVKLGSKTRRKVGAGTSLLFPDMMPQWMLELAS